MIMIHFILNQSTEPNKSSPTRSLIGTRANQLLWRVGNLLKPTTQPVFKLLQRVWRHDPDNKSYLASAKMFWSLVIGRITPLSLSSLSVTTVTNSTKRLEPDRLHQLEHDRFNLDGSVTWLNMKKGRISKSEQKHLIDLFPRQFFY